MTHAQETLFGHAPEPPLAGDMSGYSLVAQVVVDDDPVMFVPVVHRDDSSMPAVVDFGDGTKWEVDGDLDAVVDQSGDEPVLSSVPFHAYSEPGTYILTMKNVKAFCGGKTLYSASTGEATYVYVVMSQLRNVYWCTLECRDRTHYRRSSQFLGFSAVDTLVSRGPEPLCTLAVTPPKRLYLFNSPDGVLTYHFAGRAVSEYFFDGLEEFYAPNAERLTVSGSFEGTWMFCNCTTLRLVYLPKVTVLDKSYMLSSVPDRIDLYVGRLSSINYANVFRDPITDSGANVYLHVPMRGSEFRSLPGWSSGPSAHPMRAEYLRVYATDSVFDCRGNFFSTDGYDHPIDPSNGLWIDSEGRWIDRDGRFITQDGSSFAMWIDGVCYPVDESGRRVSGDGFFLDEAGRIVSDCGRPMTSDGLFVTYTEDGYGGVVPGNVVGFYGDVLYERFDLDYSWGDGFPQYSDYLDDVDQRGGQGYWCYRIPEAVGGETVEAWRFYDSYRKLVFKHYPSAEELAALSANGGEEGEGE